MLSKSVTLLAAILNQAQKPNRTLLGYYGLNICKSGGSHAQSICLINRNIRAIN